MRCFRACVALVGVALALACCRSSAGDERFTVQYDEDRFVTTVAVSADDGHVAWADIFHGVARARGYDDAVLADALPEWRLPLDGATARYLIRQANASGGEGVRVSVASDRSDAQPQLLIEVDHQAVLAAQRHYKRRLRESLLPENYRRRTFGIVPVESHEAKPHANASELDGAHADMHSEQANVAVARTQVTQTSTSATASDLVLFVHGLNSHPGTVVRLDKLARQQQLACACFHYPNDQPIEDSGELLAQELKRWKTEHPQQRVSLVTHSMGGLVARWALEDVALDPGNVDRLIMISPPSHGSLLAQFAFGLDAWEYLDAGSRVDGQCLFYSSIEDGLSEATVDLQPGSIFLTRLNRRPRNPRVQYSIVLGTGGPCSRAELDNAAGYIRAAGERNKWAQFLGSKLGLSVADLDEVVTGAGDGAVAVKRGRLAGVEDTVVLNFGHVQVLSGADQPEVQQVYREVLARLTR